MTDREDQQAATLIELLLVVTILSILTSLWLPTLHRGKSYVRKSVCQNNLKQWGLATSLYTLESRDYLPRDGAPNGRSRHSGWYIDLPKQLGLIPYHQSPWRTNPAARKPKSPWGCPSNRRKSNGHNLFHYCLNQHVNGSGAGKQVMLSSIPSPETVVWLFDNGRLAAVAQQNNVHTNLHAIGANFLFLDGHVENRPSHTYWDYERNRGRTQNPELKWHPFK